MSHPWTRNTDPTPVLPFHPPILIFQPCPCTYWNILQPWLMSQLYSLVQLIPWSSFLVQLITCKLDQGRLSLVGRTCVQKHYKYFCSKVPIISSHLYLICFGNISLHRCVTRYVVKAYDMHVYSWCCHWGIVPKSYRTHYTTLLYTVNNW